MQQEAFAEIIKDQTTRALWGVKNIMDFVPDEYCIKNTVICLCGNIFITCCTLWIYGL